uniref:Uncharacterized protein n=1 Tax=Schizaphis graminum TaxID=13262 RepID=A0A2S2NW90_SCHGA
MLIYYLNVDNMVNSFQVYQLLNSQSVEFTISSNCECTFLFIYSPNYQILIKNNYIFMTQILLLCSLYIELRPLSCIKYNRYMHFKIKQLQYIPTSPYSFTRL